MAERDALDLLEGELDPWVDRFEPLLLVPAERSLVHGHVAEAARHLKDLRLGRKAWLIDGRSVGAGSEGLVWHARADHTVACGGGRKSL